MARRKGSSITIIVLLLSRLGVQTSFSRWSAPGTGSVA
jgi:hypothetical protein